MRQSYKKLFVIIDPTSRQQIALEKALLIALMSECEIIAYLCVYEDIAEHPQYTSRSDMKHHVLADAHTRLEEIMQPCIENNIRYSSIIMWNQKWYETALQAITRSGCDLVLKSSFHHSKSIRFFNKTSDYTLMRYCSSPVLFTHKSQQWQSNRMLACVELESGDAQHIRLNNGIVRTARAIADILGMELNIAAAFEKTIDQRILRNEDDLSETTAHRLADIFGVEKDDMILRQGATVETLKDICTEVDSSILVIGSIARTGISGKLIGNTAEKLLDIVDADILTVS